MTEKTPNSELRTPNSKPIRVLIVDDNASDRKILRRYLEHSGCVVIEAEDGLEGLDMAYTHKPNLIISDALMPRMDGFLFLKNIKQDRNLREIPFIFYSATYVGGKEQELALVLGAETFIVKPKEPEEFWKALNGVLEDSKLKEKTAQPQLQLLREHEEYLERYSRIVAAKLEEKVAELDDARKKLLSTQERLKHLLSHSPALIYSCEISYPYAVTFVSDNVTELTGYTVEEFMSNPSFWADRVHPDDHPRVFADLPKLFEQKLYIHDYRFKCKDGRYRWMYDEVRLERNEKGEPLEIVGSMVDITKRKEAEEELQKSEEKYRSIFESFHDVFYRADIDGRLTLISPSIYRYSGYAPEDVIGRNALDFYVYKHDREVFMQKLMENGRVENYELKLKAKDGSERDALASSRVVFDKDGKPASIEGVLIDVTVLKRAEEDKRKLEEQLRQSQKMEVVGQLAGGVAHDFNNILTAIIGYAGLMQMKMPDSDPFKHNVEQILASAERAAALTHNLLAFSRKQMLLRKPVKVNQIIEKVGKLLAGLIGEDIEFKTLIRDGDLTVVVDSMQIEQALINLATNARDAMPGGGRLTFELDSVILDNDYISAHGYGAPGRYAMISVSDTGTGMDEKVKAKIFEPFFTTKEVGKGTGLGLSMVYGIIKQHDGYINVYSEPGKGTTFKIYLPIIAEKADTDTGPKKEVVEGKIIGGTETLLLSEDDKAVRHTISSLLQEHGYRVIEAVDGEDAIDKFTQYKDSIKLVLTDVIMPKKNADEVAREITAVNPSAKILFMSGYPRERIDQDFIKKITAEFIEKPITPTALFRKIREMLDR